MQFPGDGGAFFHQQQLLVMLLRLVKVQPAPEHGRHASHQREGNAVRLALPAQLTVKGVLHQYRQILHRDAARRGPFTQSPVVTGAEFQVIHLSVFMDNLQYVPKTMAVYLPRIQRLGAFKQHVELLVGFVQMSCLFRHGSFKRPIKGV